MRVDLGSADIWLLQAVLCTANEARATWVALRDVIAMGDALNHSIFTLSELRGGAGRLRAAGLVELEGTSFRPTERGLELFGRSSYAADIYAQRSILKALLGTKEVSGDADVLPVEDYEGISARDLRQATAEYREQIGPGRSSERDG
jgi:hypothetical protein